MCCALNSGEALRASEYRDLVRDMQGDKVDNVKEVKSQVGVDKDASGKIEVAGGEDERVEAHLGSPLQQCLLWQPRSGLQRLQPVHWPAC